DAQFFFTEDIRQGLASMNAGLGAVTYQASLGSVADKVARVAALAERIAPAAGVDPALAARAAGLSKADLQSRLVGEFPELQGIAGRYYALQDPALDDLAVDARTAVANAIDEAYAPRHAGDDIALSPLGKVLAIAERADTLAGGFAAGLRPTGNKDPFALRRNALGLARTVIESALELDLGALAPWPWMRWWRPPNPPWPPPAATRTANARRNAWTTRWPTAQPIRRRASTPCTTSSLTGSRATTPTVGSRPGILLPWPRCV